MPSALDTFIEFVVPASAALDAHSLETIKWEILNNAVAFLAIGKDRIRVQIIEDPGTQRRQVPVRFRIIVIGDTGATFMTRLRNEIAADSTVRNAQNQMILPAILDSVEELTVVMSQTPPPASPADFSSNLGLR